ncbi:UNVERIFIED_CONTAM: hypothetical protein RF648_20820, partial [Kocuria sp. CPCC 205274]
ILSCIGEIAITEIDGADDNADVANAIRCLRNANREVQSQGWTWNTIESKTLAPNAITKNIKFLDTYLRLMSTSGATIYRRRNGNVYDSSADTELFTAPIQVKMIEELAYDEMPECFRKWIIVKASRAFNIRFFGAAEIEQALQQDEEEAHRLCMEYEMDYGNFNMLDGDSWTGGRIGRS